MALNIAQRVDRGVKYLDEKIPNWLEIINLETLKLDDCNFCVMGQLVGWAQENHREEIEASDDIEPYSINGYFAATVSCNNIAAARVEHGEYGWNLKRRITKLLGIGDRPMTLKEARRRGFHTNNNTYIAEDNAEWNALTDEWAARITSLRVLRDVKFNPQPHELV